mmetsp:Transcript_10856/g.28542  ORF Transcript_10856/g.28542 Transcript_10856/m.28542 type:complete len:119 (+) Transcript_10856:190-546(+)
MQSERAFKVVPRVVEVERVVPGRPKRPHRALRPLVAFSQKVLPWTVSVRCREGAAGEFLLRVEEEGGELAGRPPGCVQVQCRVDAVAAVEGEEGGVAAVALEAMTSRIRQMGGFLRRT